MNRRIRGCSAFCSLNWWKPLLLEFVAASPSLKRKFVRDDCSAVCSLNWWKLLLLESLAAPPPCKRTFVRDEKLPVILGMYADLLPPLRRLWSCTLLFSRCWPTKGESAREVHNAAQEGSHGTLSDEDNATQDGSHGALAGDGHDDNGTMINMMITLTVRLLLSVNLRVTGHCLMPVTPLGLSAGDVDDDNDAMINMMVTLTVRLLLPVNPRVTDHCLCCHGSRNAPRTYRGRVY